MNELAVFIKILGIFCLLLSGANFWVIVTRTSKNIYLNWFAAFFTLVMGIWNVW